MKKILFIAAFAIAAVLVCGYTGGRMNTAQTTTKVTAGDVKRETGEAVKAAATYTKEKKEEYEKRAAAKLAGLREKLNGLKERGTGLSKDAREKFDRDINALKKKEGAARKKLERLRKTAGSAWDDMKKGLDSAMDDLKESYDRAAGRF